MAKYIHQLPNWPKFRWDEKALSGTLAAVRHRQGRFVGRMEALGLPLRSEAMLHATQKYDSPLTAERLFGWHAALFPTGRSGMHKIAVGAWRDDKSGPM